MIESVAQNSHMSINELNEKFHSKGEKISKALIFILIPMYAIVLRVLSFARRRYFYDDLILSTELNAILILFGFLILPALIYFIRLFFPVFNVVDGTLAVITTIGIFGYNILALRRFYKYAWWKTVILAILSVAAQITIMLYFYRWLLFDIVIRLIP